MLAVFLVADALWAGAIVFQSAIGPATELASGS